jgi:hypothetical protein
MYKWHQILIMELEIGAVGTDLFEADVVVSTRKPGKGPHMQINLKSVVTLTRSKNTQTEQVTKHVSKSVISR